MGLIILTFIIDCLSIYYIEETSLPDPGPCESYLISQCLQCKSMDWTGKYNAYKKLQGCAEKYWPNKVPQDLNDCSRIKQFCDEIVGEEIVGWV